MRKFANLIFFTCMVATPAFASVVEHTTYKPFAVQGKTARQILDSITSHSIRKEGFQTFATTEVRLTPKVKLLTKPVCKIPSATITATFVVHLPNLQNEGALSPDLRRDWRNFLGELKRHEDRHRQIWMACAASYSHLATSLPPGDCVTFARQFEKQLRAADQACSDKNDAFDAQAQKRISSIRFIQRALKDR